MSNIFAVDQAALFLDLDGTLAPIMPSPSLVGPDHKRDELVLTAQSALGGRLAVISGRAIQDLDRILGGRIPLLGGLHGLERRTSQGRIVRAAAPASIEHARAAIKDFASRHSRVTIEDKGLSIAIHYRAAPEHEGAVRAFAADAAARWGLVAQHGKMVAELRAPGPHKGDAVASFLAEPPFIGALPIFVGDDLTDEHAFAVAKEHGGAGVLVGPPRATAALGRLADPNAVLAWLSRSLEQNLFVITE